MGGWTCARIIHKKFTHRRDRHRCGSERSPQERHVIGLVRSKLSSKILHGNTAGSSDYICRVVVPGCHAMAGTGTGTRMVGTIQKLTGSACEETTCAHRSDHHCRPVLPKTATELADGLQQGFGGGVSRDGQPSEFASRTLTATKPVRAARVQPRDAGPPPRSAAGRP